MQSINVQNYWAKQFLVDMLRIGAVSRGVTFADAASSGGLVTWSDSYF
jgi:hypothetical protein